MQITNSVVCGASKGCIYKQIKPPLVGEHAFPLTGFVCMATHVTDDLINVDHISNSNLNIRKAHHFKVTRYFREISVRPYAQKYNNCIIHNDISI